MDVLVVGAGPTGLALAHELALAGVAVRVVESLTARCEQVKGGGVQPRTSELLDARGLLESMRAVSLPRERVGGHFAGLPVRLDAGAWDTRERYPLLVPQWRIEEVLERAAVARGAVVSRGRPVTAIEPAPDGVVVTAGGERLDGSWVVACDGAHSTVRRLLDLPFPGRSGTRPALLADLHLSSVSERVPRQSGHLSEMTRMGGGYWAMLVPAGGDVYRLTGGPLKAEQTEVLPTDDAAIQDLLTTVYGPETRLERVLNRSTFSDATRQLEQYRHGRILFAGDAAHIHPPFGGQGLNLGIQDAINLGWKLAATVRGTAPKGLLDTYETERHSAGARVLQHTSAQRALMDPFAPEDVGAVRKLFVELMRLPDANRYLTGMITGLDTAGRVPDLDLLTEAGPTRLYELLRTGRGLLLDLRDGAMRVPPGATMRVDVVRARGAEGAPPALLVRPDGIAAWTPADGPVEHALDRWF
jgi:2-polyprenyl-6-methoxyphenol hydroxylase-like FAD-dependent oxidoreductase